MTHDGEMVQMTEAQKSARRKRSIAHLRLLRAAVEFRLTGEVPALADPFGDTLRVREENGRRVVASVGAPGQASGYPLEIVLPD